MTFQLVFTMVSWHESYKTKLKGPQWQGSIVTIRPVEKVVTGSSFIMISSPHLPTGAGSPHPCSVLAPHLLPTLTPAALCLSPLPWLPQVMGWGWGRLRPVCHQAWPLSALSWLFLLPNQWSNTCCYWAGHPSTLHRTFVGLSEINDHRWLTSPPNFLQMCTLL